jgi:prepilin-type N-terminal cleavage/methylation domain-containing protein
MQVSSRKRRGFTLIELLVVIAIIAILVAMLLPAVQQVREAARKSQCQDHLHNLVIALHNYESPHKRLAPGAVWRGPNGIGGTAPENGRDANWGATWALMILPFIEQKPLYDLYDFEANARTGTSSTTGNNPVNQAQIDVYNCPSHPEDLTLLTQDFNGFRKGNYAANAGAGRYMRRADFNNTALRGPFSPVGQYGASFRDVTDGVSNCIFLGEVVTGPATSDDRGAFAWVSGAHFNGTANCNGVRNLTPNSRDRDCSAYASNNTNDPNINRRNDPDRPDADGGTGARSFHPGGVQFGLGDGKTTFISENVDRTVYYNLLSISDGNPVKVP